MDSGGERSALRAKVTAPGETLESDELLQLLADSIRHTIEVPPLSGDCFGLLPRGTCRPQVYMGILKWFQILIRGTDIDLESTKFQP